MWVESLFALQQTGCFSATHIPGAFQLPDRCFATTGVRLLFNKLRALQQPWVLCNNPRERTGALQQPVYLTLGALQQPKNQEGAVLRLTRDVWIRLCLYMQ